MSALAVLSFHLGKILTIASDSTLSEVEASEIVRKITSAVAYMHACGVVHRDLKPGTTPVAFRLH